MYGTNWRIPTLAANRLKGRGDPEGGGEGGFPPPSALALDPDTFAQEAVSGTVVGTLTATDPVVGATHTFQITSGGAEFAIDGDELKTAATFENEVYFFRDMSIRVLSSSGQQVTKPVIVYITPTDDDNDSGLPGDPDPPGDQDQVVNSPNFPVPPFTANADDVLKITGKSGGLAKIIIDIGPAVAGRWYKAKWSADWTQLTKQGKKAFIGFGWRKANDDFHFTGFKGDGTATGVRVTTISAQAKFNKGKQIDEFVVTDFGAAVGYTQSGPNWARLDTAGNGVTYDLSSTLDGDILSLRVDDQIPTPLGRVTDAEQFGFAIFLEHDDKGPFSVSLEVWMSDVPGYGKNYGLSYGQA